MARTKADRRSMEVRAQIHEMKRRRRMEEATAEEAQGEASTAEEPKVEVAAARRMEEAKAEEAQAEASKAEEPKAEVAAAMEPTSDGDSQTTLVLGGVAAEEAEAEEAEAACSTYRSDEEEKWRIAL